MRGFRLLVSRPDRIPEARIHPEDPVLRNNTNDISGDLAPEWVSTIWFYSISDFRSPMLTGGAGVVEIYLDVSYFVDVNQVDAIVADFDFKKPVGCSDAAFIESVDGEH